jgi:hypothetical protein
MLPLVGEFVSLVHSFLAYYPQAPGEMLDAEVFAALRPDYFSKQTEKAYNKPLMKGLNL